MEFSLRAFVATKGKSGHISSITPKKFKVGDKVRRLNPTTLKPYSGEPSTVLAVRWYGSTWFYETIHGVWTREDFLEKA